MTARTPLSSILLSITLRPWSIPFLYSAGFFSSVFECFALWFGVIVFDFLLLRPILLFFFAMVCCRSFIAAVALFLLLVVIKIEQLNQQ